MTATIHMLPTRPVFTIDISSADRRPIGSFDAGAETGTCVSGVEIDVLQPGHLAGGARGRARVVAVGKPGRDLLAQALKGPLNMRCRAMPDGMRWLILEVVGR